MNATETHITEPINAAHAVLIEIDEALPIARISKLIGCPVSETKKQLKELARLGLIETELRKGGASFYRLTAAPAEMQVTSAQMQVTSGEMQATSAPLSPATLTETRSISSEMQHTSNVCNKCLGSGFLPKAMSLPEPPDVKCPNGCKPPIDWTAPEMQYLAPEDYELPPADPEFLALANRELGQQLEAAKVERDDLRARLDALTEQWEADTGRLTADLRAAIEAKSHAINEADRLRAELAVERQAREALQEHDIAGYIVSATKREPLMCKSLNKARKVAMSAIRSGARRAAVNPVLPPVGVAIKGAEWRAKA